MPEGIVREFNANRGSGLIEDDAGRYLVAAEDMATNTRFEGARVQFDIERGDRRQGGERDHAVNVRLRSGTHHHRDQRRFGDTGG